MNQIKRTARQVRRIRREREKGFTLLEILVGLGVLALVIAIAIGVFQERAENTTPDAIATQAGGVMSQWKVLREIQDTTAANRGAVVQQLAQELNASLNGLASIAQITSTGTNTTAITGEVPACSAARIDIQDATLDENQNERLAERMVVVLTNVWDANEFVEATAFLAGTPAPVTPVATTPHASATHAYICFNS
ncbi:MAG: prepilin-type N-terminal cleavage/methylation domain-containing protein [Bacteroidetes bacterium SB0662_bin_6]|nr:prepilin-type N-terminal cleavage/methylation domain-containing protein [Bacteroidetes bacterium SB0662_bin_6]